MNNLPINWVDAPDDRDPTGLDQHTPGAKLDSGKVRPELVLDAMSRAILAVCDVATFGANKYSDSGWLEVPNGITRYQSAKDRHRLKGAIEECDPESGFLHAAHEAWNALARLELVLRAKEDQATVPSNPPAPTLQPVPQVADHAGVLDRVKTFSGEDSPTVCLCDHKLQGTGAVFFQSIGSLKCTRCKGWQFIRKPI